MTPSQDPGQSHRVELRARANQHFTYSGRSVLVTNLDGCIRGEGTEGFYVDNTRLLCREVVKVDGREVEAIVASPVRGERFLSYAQALIGDGAYVGDGVYLETDRVVDDAGLRSTFRLRNYGLAGHMRFELAIELAADFADLEEAQAGERQQAGAVEDHWQPTPQELWLRYVRTDLDRAVVVTVVRAPAPAAWSDGALRLPIELAQAEATEIELLVEPVYDGRRGRDALQAGGEPAVPLDELRGQLRAGATRVVSTNASVSVAWETAALDLASFPLGVASGPATPVAGLPIYLQFFGRDSLTIAWQGAMAVPEMLGDTLRANAAGQGTRIDDAHDEEPGKMIHQARGGPLSVLGINPFGRYYGDWATVPDFLAMLGQFVAWSGDLGVVRSLLPAARRGVEWVERYADLDRDGFIEYLSRAEQGVANQGWKDSDDAIVDEDGRIVRPPIATSEIQAFLYGALDQASLAFLAANDASTALRLRRRARALRERFDAEFWLDDLGFYAMALGPDGRPVRSIGSNAGHLLAAGLIPAPRARRVAQRLLADDMFSGWGIRTLSSDHPAYNPFSYHRGSVWPVEVGTICFGLARYGLWDELHRLAHGFFDATELFSGHRLPEVLGGVQRDAAHPHPGLYAKSNQPQGWSSSAVVLVVQSLLGLRPIAPLGLVLVDPHLPDWLPDLRLEGLRVGKGRIDVSFERQADGSTRTHVTGRDRSLRVVRQPVPNGPQASPVGRIGAALASVVRRA